MSNIHSSLPGTDMKVGVFFWRSSMAYVYGHYKADTGELFYIGKGTGNRAWSNHGRSVYWKRVAEKHGRAVQIIEDNLTDEEAYIKEKELIEVVGLNNLVNIIDGGYGITSDDVKRIDKIHPTRNIKAAIAGKVAMKDTTIKKKHLESVRKVTQTDEWKQRQLTGLKNKTSSDEWKRKHQEGIEKRALDPSWKEKQRERSIKYWESKRKKKLKLEDTE
jgi:hypothetical protein